MINDKKGIYDFVNSNRDYICETLLDRTKITSTVFIISDEKSFASYTPVSRIITHGSIEHRSMTTKYTIKISTFDTKYVISISPNDDMYIYNNSEFIKNTLLDIFKQYKRDNKINEILN